MIQRVNETGDEMIKFEMEKGEEAIKSPHQKKKKWKFWRIKFKCSFLICMSVRKLYGVVVNQQIFPHADG